MEKLAKDFEALCGLHYTIGPMDGRHIPIIAPHKDPADYLCRKGFYIRLLQALIDTNYMIWYYDFGWARSMNDWNLFQGSELGNNARMGNWVNML